MTQTTAESTDSLVLRQFRESDYDDIFQLISHENWFILEMSTWEKVIRELQPVFYVLVDEKAAIQVKGTVGVSKTRDGEAMVGDVVIRDGFRGRGLGRFMMQNTLKLHKDVTLTLFSTTDPFYKSVGMNPCGQDAFYGDLTLGREKVVDYCHQKTLEDGIRIVTFTEDRKDDLITYDAAARGYRAEKCLSLTIAASNYLALAVKGTEERIVGYMANLLQPAGNFYASGCYADDQTIASHLLRKTLENFPNVERLRIYTLATRQFLLEFGHLAVSEIHTRLAYGGIPARICEDKLYAFNQPDFCC